MISHIIERVEFSAIFFYTDNICSYWITEMENGWTTIMCVIMTYIVQHSFLEYKFIYLQKTQFSDTTICSIISVT